MERRKYICIFFGMLVKDEEVKGRKLVKGGEVVLILKENGSACIFLRSEGKD